MIILTLNPGSTSVKISLFENQKRLFHEDIVGSLDDVEKKIISEGYNFAGIDKFAVRVVHGGSFFTEPTKITNESLAKLREISELAPLHNPPALKIIEEILAKKKEAEIWAIFDTAFHATIPEKYALYAIPLEISREILGNPSSAGLIPSTARTSREVVESRDFSIKKYGFHGTANQSAIHLVEKKTNSPIPTKTIICHLGGGASVTAVQNGKSISNSMGFTPLEGLIMVTRAGDLDNGVVEFLMHKLGLSIEEVLQILNKESGIYGLTGTKDLAEVFENPAKKPEYDLALEMYLARLEKYIWAYIGRLGGLDCLIFSGGTGEHNAKVREKIRGNLAKLGFEPEVHVVHVEEDMEMMRQIS